LERHKQYVVYGVNGPVVTVKDAPELSMRETVYVGNYRLVGEVIAIKGSLTVIQVYEVTTGVRPGEPVYATGKPMSVKLGPGILSNIFDGVQRPLRALEKESGCFIGRGAQVEPLDRGRLWDVKLTVKKGDALHGGDIYATVPETALVTHRCLLHPELSGTVVEVVPDGAYRIDDTVAVIEDGRGRRHSLTLCHEWPIRTPRPIGIRHELEQPLVTGQRVIDTLFPVAKGGAAAVPGGFGTGKTLTQHQLAKWCDADIIVYVGCGERGNEMTQALAEFSELTDPKSGRPLTDRTVLIANTSNMPVAAREASIYTGITLAEYYRDMGYHVALMADSTSRWAEALREIAGRLEEMPAEEGFPAYLPSRLSQFYERAGYVETLGGGEGSVTVIGAVSPQGSDFSEPVTQNTKRFVRCFWALDKALAYARHYPAVNWSQSYTEYIPNLEQWYASNISGDFLRQRARLANILQEESKLMEIVKLIGADVLLDDQKLIIETARVIRVGFLQQNAYHPQDTYTPLKKQLCMMNLILYLYDAAKALIDLAIPISQIKAQGHFDRLVKMKYDISGDGSETFLAYEKDIEASFARLRREHSKDQ